MIPDWESDKPEAAIYEASYLAHASALSPKALSQTTSMQIKNEKSPKHKESKIEDRIIKDRLTICWLLVLPANQDSNSCG